MKNLLKTMVLAMVLLTACTTNFDLYSYEGDSTIVYAVLESDADTNFFRITKSSLCNELTYNYDDIDVMFSGLFDNESRVDTVSLDTISIMHDGESRTYYFTTKKLLEGQEYTLLIHRKTDDVTVVSKTRTISRIRFLKPIGKYINLRKINIAHVEWIGLNTDIAPRINAGYFEVVAYFHYKELMPGATDTVERSMEWHIMADDEGRMYNTTNYYYNASYKPITFFEMLERDDYLKNNSPYGVQRWLEPFEFRIIIYGTELYNYHIVNNSTSAIPEMPNYSNVENGVGIMSSRITKSTFHVIEQICRKRITENYDYGFYYDPNL